MLSLIVGIIGPPRSALNSASAFREEYPLYSAHYMPIPPSLSPVPRSAVGHLSERIFLSSTLWGKRAHTERKEGRNCTLLICMYESKKKVDYE